MSVKAAGKYVFESVPAGHNSMRLKSHLVDMLTLIWCGSFGQNPLQEYLTIQHTPHTVAQLVTRTGNGMKIYNSEFLLLGCTLRRNKQVS